MKAEDIFYNFKFLLSQGISLIDIKYLEDGKSNAETTLCVPEFLKNMIDQSPGILIAGWDEVPFYGACCIAVESNLSIDDLLSGNIRDKDWPIINQSLEELVAHTNIVFIPSYYLNKDSIDYDVLVLKLKEELKKCNYIVIDKNSIDTNTDSITQLLDDLSHELSTATYVIDASDYAEEMRLPVQDYRIKSTVFSM